MSDIPVNEPSSRRNFLKRAAVTAIAGGALAACNDNNVVPKAAAAPVTPAKPTMSAAESMDKMHEAGIKAFPAKTEGKGNQPMQPRMEKGVKVYELTAEKIHTTMQSLGSNAQHIAVLAVSMYPKGDTAAAAQNFSKAHKLGNYFYYLIGTHNDLAPVWASYSVDAQAATSSGTVNHSSAIYVIDKQGRERVLLDNDFSSNQLASDLKILLGE